MNLFIDKHQELITQLINNKVEFIIIGGYSVIFHGYKRTTGDVDIWLKPTNNNKKKLLKVLEMESIVEEDIKTVEDLNFEDHHVFSIWEEPEKVDFITRINIVDFEMAYKNKINAEVDGIIIPFIHLNDLIISKFNTGRTKDQADIEQLQKIHSKKTN
jgi:predicted nucleotidyltransferase